MKVFISHSHAENQLAKALKELFDTCVPGVNVWYSSDKDPAGGIGPGDWRDSIKEELDSSDIVLGMFTPESENKQWIFFECAYAIGKNPDNDDAVVPLLYYMDKSSMPSPLANLQSYNGDDAAEMMDFVSRIWRKQNRKDLNDKIKEVWQVWIEEYLTIVKAYGQERIEKELFYTGFHVEETGKKLAGKWFAKWTQIDDAGNESVFETDELNLWSTKSRVRLVGKGAKGALYPMEGVVSSKGQLALSYWSSGDIPICGTSLLELIGGNSLMEGTWEGFTARTLKERLNHTRGRVVMGREKKDVDNYWRED